MLSGFSLNSPRPDETSGALICPIRRAIISRGNCSRPTRVTLKSPHGSKISAWLAWHTCRVWNASRRVASSSGSRRNRGFKYQTEIDLLNDAPEEHDEIKVRLHPVMSDLDWTAKRALHVASGTGPDGHDNAPGLWANLEQRKSEAGGLELNLVMRGGDVIRALDLMAEKSILRLKNLVIHPDYRGFGFGAEAVHAGCAEAVRRGYTAVGAFALEQKRTLAFYESCGFRPVATQTEWTPRD